MSYVDLILKSARRTKRGKNKKFPLPQGLLHPYHVQLASVLHEAGEGIGCEYAGSEGEVRVDHGLVLLFCSLSNGRIKAGPKHP